MSEPSTPRSSATSGRKIKRDDFEEEDADECEDPRAGLEDRVERQLQRKLVFTKTNGYHWPGWYFAEFFKEWEEKPKIKRRLAVAGEAGVVLDSKHGNDNIAIATIGEVREDGVFRGKVLARASKLKNLGELYSNCVLGFNSLDLSSDILVLCEGLIVWNFCPILLFCVRV